MFNVRFSISLIFKLDVGTDEKIVLMSRDETNMLVVSYKDLKRCIEMAFNELMSQCCGSSSAQ